MPPVSTDWRRHQKPRRHKVVLKACIKYVDLYIEQL